MKNLKAKLNLTKTLCVFLSICLMLSLGAFLRVAPSGASASTDYKDFISKVTVSNNQFEADTSNAPVSPNGWTGSYINGLSGSVTSGVISFDTNFKKNYDDFNLDKYPDFSKNQTPATPFGNEFNNVHKGTNKNVLMINNLASTAYGYSSESITLDANAYYKFSVWVRTGSFGDKQGAAVTLTGLDKPAGIWNIDTVDQLGGAALTADNNYGFVEHIIYAGTGPNSETVNLKLSVGDFADSEHYFTSAGYAFFANVNVSKLSPTAFNRETLNKVNGDKLCIYDMNPTDAEVILKDGDTDIGSFINGKSGWTKISNEEEASDPVMWDTYDGGSVYIEEHDGFGFTADPFTPGGKFDPINKTLDTNQIMVMSSTNGDSFKSVSAGIRSAGITIEKESYYRLSAWYNTQEGANANIVISGESTSYANEYKLGPIVSGDLNTTSSADRYGWGRTSFYIKGSAFKAVEINVELWLGKNEKTAGIAMFDDITLEKISFEDFTDNKFGGTVVNIDTTSSSSTVTNGDFAEMDFDGENTYPLAPTGWTYIDPTTAGTIGQSDKAVAMTADAKIVSGVTPTEAEHYEAHKSDYLDISNPSLGGTAFKNVNTLLMATTEPTAFGYRSSELTISGGSDYKLTVRLKTALSGYGASLILKNGNKIVSNIEKIKSANFKDYSFYISGASAETKLTLEIWLGMTDSVKNLSKLSSGHMFVSSVNLETLSGDENGVTVLPQMLEKYNSTPLSILDFAVYRLGAFDFNAYDRFSTEAVKPMYDMTLNTGSDTIARAGVIAGTLPAGHNLPSYLYDAHNATEGAFANVVMLQNISSGYSTYTADSTLTLTANSYYKVDFSLLVDLEDESAETAIGAGIWLDGYGIKDIKNTHKVPALTDENGNVVKYEFEFKTFSFYYAVGTEDRAANWHISLGGNEFANESIRGSVFLNSIVVTEIDQTTFEIETEALTDDDVNILSIDNSVAQDETETTPPEDELNPDDLDGNDKKDKGCSSVEWYVIPSILFAAAVFIAIFGVVIKKLLARRPRNKNKQKTVSYDRKDTLNTATQTPDEKRSGEVVATTSGDPTYDQFEDAEAVENKPAPAAATKAEEVEVPAEKAVTETPEVEEKVVIDNEFDD